MRNDTEFYHIGKQPIEVGQERPRLRNITSLNRLAFAVDHVQLDACLSLSFVMFVMLSSFFRDVVFVFVSSETARWEEDGGEEES